MKNNSFIKNLYKGLRRRMNLSFQNPYKPVNLSWLKLKYYKHLSSDKLRIHYLFGKALFFNNPQELLHGFQDIFLEEIYKQELQNEPYVIDCGAHIGLSIIYMKYRYPKAEIVAFEPDKKNFDLLTKNMHSFGYNNVRLFNEAVWTEDTTLLFSSTGSMSSQIVQKYDDNTAQVKAIRLKNLINREIDFLKIDIEGAEFDVLEDIKDNLHFVKNMFLEYHGMFGQNNDLIKLLSISKACGFNFYIKEATSIYKMPFYRIARAQSPYDLQLNIFCFRI